MSLEGGSLTASMVSNLNTDRSGVKSPTARRSPTKNDAKIQQKLDTLSVQLADIRQKRSELKKFDDGRIYGPKKDYTTVPKKLFSHPRLDFVYGEIMFSPYMTNPKDSYPKETYLMADKLKSLKHKNVAFKDLPTDEKPYDEKLLKKQFIREVCNYNPKFNIPKSIKAGDGSSKPGTANSSVAHNRSSMTTASSTTSLKETGSLRRRQLNKLNTRKHASATAMSLDASGFRPNTGSSSLLGGDANSSGAESPAKAMAEAIAKLTASTAEASATASQPAAADKMSEQPESPSRADDPTGDQAGDQYEEDFEGTAPAAPPSAAAGMNKDSVGHVTTAAVETADEEVYDADFEQTGVLPAALNMDVPIAAPAPTSAVADETETATPTGDEYGDDFEQIAAINNEEAVETQVALLTKQSTANSEIQEDMPSQFISSVPSTVRSEATETQDASLVQTSSGVRAGVGGALVEEGEGSTRSTYSTRDTVPSRTAPVAASDREHDQEQEVDSEKMRDAVLDEPLEEILYLESNPGGSKEDPAVRNNNYLNSPARGAKQSGSADSNDVEEDVQGGMLNIPSGSPGRNMDHPDEEIGEEYES